jgi:transcription termination factor Rho
MSDTNDVSDLIGAPQDAGQLSAAPVALEERPTNTLVVDDRMIPDAGLPTDYVEGVLDIANEGSGLLRPQRFAPSDHDVYISASQIRRFNLRVGDMVGGQARRPKENERYWGLLKVEKVNGEPVEKLGTRVEFFYF